MGLGLARLAENLLAPWLTSSLQGYVFKRCNTL